MNGKTFLVIGGDAAGMSAASKIKRMRPEDNVIVLEKGEYISYASCGLPYFISGVITDIKKLLVLTPETAREKRGIDVRIHHEAIRIHPFQRVVTALNHNSGKIEEITYDKLLIATGASPFVPPIEGIELPGVFTLRGIENGIQIREYALRKDIEKVIIVGAGYVGLEMAEAFQILGKKVTVVEMLPQAMPGFSSDLAEMIHEELRSKGVNLMFSREVRKIIGDNNHIVKIATDVEELAADMALISVGVHPNAALAGDAGIGMGKSGAIAVNDRMQTSASNIYAAGDCVEYKHLITGKPVYIPLAPAANKGGRVAGENMAGKVARFPGILGTAVAKVFGLEVARTGLSLTEARKAGFEAEQALVAAPSRAHYYPGAKKMKVALIYEKKTGRVLGGQIVGRDGVSKRIDIIGVAAAARLSVNDLARMDLAYAPPFSPVYDPVNIAAGVAKV